MATETQKIENPAKKQKIQLLLNNKQAIDLYQVFKHGTRTLMIEQAIILLAQNETMRNLFLDEYDKMKVDDILASAKLVENSSNNEIEEEEDATLKQDGVSTKNSKSAEKQVDVQSPVSVGW